MSETFRVGDNVVFRDVNGVLLTHYGFAQVIASDLSWVVVNRTNYAESYDFKPLEDPQYCWKFNAGTGKYKHDPNSAMMWTETTFYVSHPSDADRTVFAERDALARALKLSEDIESALNDQSEATLETVLAILNGTDRTCSTCRFWRPPYDDFGPGNCHNSTVSELTKYGNETYPPPTRAEFGCNQWKAKEEPENGDDSDE